MPFVYAMMRCCTDAYQHALEVSPMGEILKKGTRVTGTDRTKLAADLKKRYEAGESIRSLAAATGRSYGFVQRILAESGVSLRGGGRVRGRLLRRGNAASGQLSGAGRPEIPIQIFLTDASAGPAVEESLRGLLLTAGVEDIHYSHPGPLAGAGSRVPSEDEDSRKYFPLQKAVILVVREQDRRPGSRWRRSARRPAWHPAVMR
jgi:hypothetical protein